MQRSYYAQNISKFLVEDESSIVGQLTLSGNFSLDITQRDAWVAQVRCLKECLVGFEGRVLFEFSIPRMGKRIDTVILIKNTVFVVEFKVGETQFNQHDIDQVYDYALDLKNFHEGSRHSLLAPIIVPTHAKPVPYSIEQTTHNDNVLFPIRGTARNLRGIIEAVLKLPDSQKTNVEHWEKGRYHPTPTIIEAATALYEGHDVAEISRSDASAVNLSDTCAEIERIIEFCRTKKEKAICFVTGVPGAGKTLVGLNIATRHAKTKNETNAVFLSGNGPLVDILREALTRNKYVKEKQAGRKTKKGEISSRVKTFIQNVHHFRDDCLQDKAPPFEHIAIFDEAQRAWDKSQTAEFMRMKKNRPDFEMSEPDFLISCLDRHQDWAVVICLVGGGQEINKGEAGITGWLNALQHKYLDWRIYISENLLDEEYSATVTIQELQNTRRVFSREHLHLSVSLRSFRAESLSGFIKKVLDREPEDALVKLNKIKENYPLVITRDLQQAKTWLRTMARGTERYGLLVSSQALRLKPLAIDIRSKIDPVHWFLGGKDDTRSSYYLEDAATEFQAQGLELDWACVTWDADFRFSRVGWGCYSFVGTKWNNIKKGERKTYLKNAYRVLLTRARQGLIIVVPYGDNNDATRLGEYYDQTYEYLKGCGMMVLDAD